MGIPSAALLKTGSAVLILAVLCSPAALGKEREWRDAQVIDITTEKGGAMVVPVSAFVSGPMTKTFYWIETDDTIYVLGPVLTRSQLLNVTLHEPTKIAVEGNRAHILDDYGKDDKLRVFKRVARPKSENAP